MPALNDLLAPFGVAFGDSVVQGTLGVAGLSVAVQHGADIARFPEGGWLHHGKVGAPGGNLTERWDPCKGKVRGAEPGGQPGGQAVRG